MILIWEKGNLIIVLFRSLPPQDLTHNPFQALLNSQIIRRRMRDATPEGGSVRIMVYKHSDEGVA
jgi:hypothetical protein